MFIRPFRTRSLNDFKIEIFWLIFSAMFFLTHSEIKANEWSNWLGPNNDGSIDNMDVTIPPSGKEYIVRWKKNIGI